MLLFFSCALFSFTAALPCYGLVVAERAGILYVSGTTVRVQYDLESGTFDLLRPSGEVVIKGGTAEALLSGDAGEMYITMAGAGRLAWFYSPIEDIHGKGIEATVVLHGSGPAPDFSHSIRMYETAPFIIFSAAVENFSTHTFFVERISPLALRSADGGGLFLGLDPENVRIAGGGGTGSAGGLPPGGSGQGASKEVQPEQGNMFAALFDPPSERGLVGGFLSAATGEPFFEIAKTGDTPVEDVRTGRAGVAKFIASSGYFPSKSVPQNNVLNSESLYFEIAWQEPFDAMTRYAEAVAAENHVGQDVLRAQSYWSSGTQNSGKVNTPEAIKKNIDAATAKFGAFGLDAIEIGPGWQSNFGDWEPSAVFSGKMKSLAAYAKLNGFKPSIWISPFLVDLDSKVYRDHPEWIIEKLSPWANARMPAGRAALDMSRADTREYVGGIIRKLTADWGFESLRIEVHPCALGAVAYNAGGRTRIEIFRKALRAIRAAAGEGVRMSVEGAPPEFSIGIADAAGLDTETSQVPAGIAETDDFLERRLFGNDSLPFFNGSVLISSSGRIPAYAGDEDPGRKQEAGVDDEYMSLINATAIIGGDIRIEEAPVDISPAVLNVIRRILPIGARAAVPVGLFTNEYPDVYALKASKTHDVLTATVFNRDILPDTDSAANTSNTIHFYFSRLGLAPNSECLIYDFWNDEYLGSHKFGYSATLAPGASKVLTIREITGRPQLLSTNRHFPGEGSGILSVEWNSELLFLKIKIQTISGFEHRITFYIPEGFTLLKTALDGKETDGNYDQKRHILELRFTPAATGTAEWKLDFGKK